MKNLFGIIMLISISFSAQTKQELDKIMVSKDPYEISNFIKKYPQNPNVSFLKRKLETLKEKPTVYSNNDVVPAAKKVEVSNAGNKKTEDVLNHLFNNDPKGKEAYLQIKNQSDCNIRVKLEGDKSYYMDIPSKGESYILIPKGYYNISANICNAQYSSLKNITQDMQLKLGAPKKVRN